MSHTPTDVSNPALDAQPVTLDHREELILRLGRDNVALRAERDAALARESEAYARGVHAAARAIDTAGDGSVAEALSTQLCCNGHHCGCHGADVGTYLQHIIRALADAPPAPVVKVNPLVWRVQSSDCQIADTPWGACAVQNESHVLSPNRWGWWAVGSDEDDSPSGYEIGIQAAKAAAQADYEARILAALLPQAGQ